MGNRNPYIEEEQTTQWPKHTHKTKDRVTRTPLKTGLNSGAPEMLAVPAPLVAPVKAVHQNTTFQDVMLK